MAYSHILTTQVSVHNDLTTWCHIPYEDNLKSQCVYSTHKMSEPWRWLQAVRNCATVPIAGNVSVLL